MKTIVFESYGWLEPSYSYYQQMLGLKFQNEAKLFLWPELSRMSAPSTGEITSEARPLRSFVLRARSMQMSWAWFDHANQARDRIFCIFCTYSLPNAKKKQQQTAESDSARSANCFQILESANRITKSGRSWSWFIILNDWLVDLHFVYAIASPTTSTTIF